MPTYDYSCKACGHELEAFHKISEPLTHCPKCKKETLEQKFVSGSGIQIQGKPSAQSSGGCCPCGKNKGSCR